MCGDREDMKAMSDQPAVREYQVYLYDTSNGSGYYWSKPFLAGDVRHAVRILETMTAGTGRPYAKNQIRIVKVVASGELVEVPPLHD